ncbi:MAG: class I tRNA ligase family protein [Candidatus Peregrinibacteria bacterium]|nr:class I tRNA ligase family protein [Candidatus Peregrinibacteria bacterium]
MRFTFRARSAAKQMNRIPDVLDCWFESGAMPYAQLHYPFEKKKEFEDNFPADFIAEGLDQTRGWFYTLHVISTILWNKPAFKNVIVNGILLAADGEKLSKRKKNYPDPNMMFDTRGVDSMRMFLYTSPATLGDDVRFSERHVDEIVKSFTLTIWNVYSFFMTYASIDKWVPEFTGKKMEKFRPEHTLDQWILSELNTLVKSTTDAMDNYNFMEATRPMITFADDLSNWYVRRSRRRFWKSESDADKQSAYQTLYIVLYRLSQLMAPYMPFLSEYMYQGLTKGIAGESESVHLTNWPEAVKKLMKPLLNTEMHIVRQIVNLGHSARANASIKVRQPLASVSIATPDEVSVDVIEKYRDIILEELNVKQIEYIRELGDRVKIKYTPKSKLLGPKFGKDVQDIIRMVKSGDIQAIAGGRYQVGSFVLNAEDIEVGYEAQDGAGVASENGYTLLLDTHITETLVQEGIAREIVRFVQDMRKEATYDVSDRISLVVESEHVEISTAVTAFADYIRKETLAEELQQGGAFDSDLKKVLELDTYSVTVAIAKSAK